MSHSCRYWSDIVHSLEPYVPGEQPKIANLIKLNTNESPYPPSPKVRKAITDQAIDDLRLYSDPQSKALKQAIAQYYDVSSDRVFVGNGSDEVLAHVFQAFFTGREEPLLFPDISYSFYPVYCNLFEVDSLQLPLAEDFSIDLTQYEQPNGGIIFPNPNAPTGILKPLEAIEKLLNTNADSVVVVDEAYIDFGGESALSLIERYPNLVVVQTLSKSRALAGARVGFAIAQPSLIEALVRVKDSFNSYPVNRLSEAAAVASFEDDAYFQDKRQAVINTRERTITALKTLGFDSLPSAANFVFAKPSKVDAQTLFQGLRERGILVRYFNKPRLSEYLRISIGTDQEMDALISAIAQLQQL